VLATVLLPAFTGVGVAGEAGWTVVAWAPPLACTNFVGRALVGWACIVVVIPLEAKYSFGGSLVFGAETTGVSWESEEPLAISVGMDLAVFWAYYLYI